MLPQNRFLFPRKRHAVNVLLHPFVAGVTAAAAMHFLREEEDECKNSGKKLAKSWQKVCEKFVKIRSEHLLKILKRSEEEEEGEGDL
jgi:hypothetical protein